MVDRYNNSNIVNGQVVDKNTPLSQVWGRGWGWAWAWGWGWCWNWCWY